MTDADWADYDDGASNPIPPREVVDGSDGVQTITEYGASDEGYLSKTVKVVKIGQITRTVSKAVAARKHWKKFGDCAGKPDGLERGISTVSVDEIFMEWMEQAGAEEEEEEEVDYASIAAKDIQGMLRMERMKRRMEERKKGVANWAQLMALEAQQRNPDEPAAPGLRGGDNGGSMVGGKYVPPSKRSGAGGASMMGESMYGHNDSMTVRISNLSKATTEADLEELCQPFGETRRIYLSRDRDTNESKGFAFVTFREKRDAERTIEKLNGYVGFKIYWPCQPRTVFALFLSSDFVLFLRLRSLSAWRLDPLVP
jgi:translation initiation factor 3 subunit G